MIKRDGVRRPWRAKALHGPGRARRRRQGPKRMAGPDPERGSAVRPGAAGGGEHRVHARPAFAAGLVEDVVHARSQALVAPARRRSPGLPAARRCALRQGDGSRRRWASWTNVSNHGARPTGGAQRGGLASRMGRAREVHICGCPSCAGGRRGPAAADRQTAAPAPRPAGGPADRAEVAALHPPPERMVNFQPGLPNERTRASRAVALQISTASGDRRTEPLS